VGREGLRAPDDGALVGLLEAEVEGHRGDRELHLDRRSDLCWNVGPACPEAFDSLGGLQRIEHRLGGSLDIEAKQNIGHTDS
jgi:hypothetical protein